MPTKIPAKKPTRRHNALWVFFLAVLITGALVGLFVYPTYRQLEQARADIVAVEKNIADRTKALALWQETNKNPQPTQRELLLRTQIPSAPEKTELIRYLESITPYRYVADGQKTLLKSFTLRDEGAPAASRLAIGEHAAASAVLPGSIAIQGVLESSQAAFLQFLHELERTDRRLFTVNQLSWREARDAKTPITSEIQFTVNMQTYYQADNSTD